jgi:hypothetical protein
MTTHAHGRGLTGPRKQFGTVAPCDLAVARAGTLDPAVLAACAPGEAAALRQIAAGPGATAADYADARAWLARYRVGPPAEEEVA